MPANNIPYMLQRRNPNLIPPFRRMALIKSNDWYYKPHSQPSCGVGGSCNRAILNRKKKRL